MLRLAVPATPPPAPVPAPPLPPMAVWFSVTLPVVVPETSFDQRSQMPPAPPVALSFPAPPLPPVAFAVAVTLPPAEIDEIGFIPAAPPAPPANPPPRPMPPLPPIAVPVDNDRAGTRGRDRGSANRRAAAHRHCRESVAEIAPPLPPGRRLRAGHIGRAGERERGRRDAADCLPRRHSPHRRCRPSR